VQTNCKKPGVKALTENLPWDRRDIFHDEIASYPQPDYFPLADSKTQSKTEKEEETAGA